MNECIASHPYQQLLLSGLSFFLIFASLKDVQWYHVAVLT